MSYICKICKVTGVKDVCQYCYEHNSRIIMCAKRTCKRYVTINLIDDDPDQEYFCGHARCKGNLDQDTDSDPNNEE
jgi:hypothetical protein